jgi:hypothetical protein
MTTAEMAQDLDMIDILAETAELDALIEFGYLTADDAAAILECEEIA